MGDGKAFGYFEGALKDSREESTYLLEKVSPRVGVSQISPLAKVRGRGNKKVWEEDTGEWPAIKVDTDLQQEHADARLN